MLALCSISYQIKILFSACVLYILTEGCILIYLIIIIYSLPKTSICAVDEIFSILLCNIKYRFSGDLSNLIELNVYSDCEHPMRIQLINGCNDFFKLYRISYLVIVII